MNLSNEGARSSRYNSQRRGTAIVRWPCAIAWAAVLISMELQPGARTCACAHRASLRPLHGAAQRRGRRGRAQNAGPIDGPKQPVQ
eukprot:7384431-Prymnesium_polylepis.1